MGLLIDITDRLAVLTAKDILKGQKNKEEIEKMLDAFPKEHIDRILEKAKQLAGQRKR